jgi:hypothetical protein
MMVERSSVAYPDENLDTDGVTVLPINAVPLGRSLYYPVVRAGIVDPASPDPQDPDLILKQNIIRPPADPGFVWQDIPTPNRFNIHWDLPASVPDYIYMMLDYTLIYLRSPVNNFRHYDSVDRVPFNGIHWNALIVERTDSGRSFASNWVLTNFEEWKRVFGTDHYLVVRYLRDPPPP